MSTAFSTPERVPYPAVERLLRNFGALLSTVEAALAAEPAEDAAAAPRPEAARWLRAHALLVQEHEALQREADAFAAADREPLLRHAAELRLLVHRMDGYALDFAGDDTAAALQKQRLLLVLTAWQIAAAANGLEAAGL